MTYKIEHRPQDRALLVTWFADFNFIEQGQALTMELMELLAELKQPVFFVNDVREANFSYEELIEAANAAANGDNPLFKHPMILGAVSVTTSKLVELAAAGMDTATFKNTKVFVVDNLEKAFDISRTR